MLTSFFQVPRQWSPPPPLVVDFFTSQRDPAPGELPDNVYWAMEKIPLAWAIGVDAESGWNPESSFLLAQALGFQSSIVLEQCMKGRDAKVAQHWEVRRERDQAKAAADEAKAKMEKARAASKELEAKVARLKDEAARQRAEADRALAVAWKQFEDDRAAVEKVVADLLRAERDLAAMLQRERDQSREEAVRLTGEKTGLAENWPKPSAIWLWPS